MFEFSRQKRLQIISQIGDKRERMTSNQRRRLVEDEYNQFIKTMNNIKPNTINPPQMNSSEQSIKFNNHNQEPVRDSLQLSYSPTLNEIPKAPTDRESLQQQFYQIRPSQSPKRFDSPEKMNQMNFNRPNPFKNQQPIQQNLNQLKEEKSINQSQHKMQDEQIKYAVNPSVQPSSVNSSEAIFFTSQFKDYINKQNSPPKELNQSRKMEQNKKQQTPKVKFQENQALNQRVQIQKHEERILKSNPSGQSLALSNDSSLKFSLHESAVHEVIAQKLKKQLVVDSIGDSKRFRVLRELALFILMKENIKDFMQFGRQMKLLALIKQNQKKRFFLQLMIKHQILFQLTRNQIRVKNYRKDVQYHSLKACFEDWKKQTIDKKQAIESFVEKKQLNMLQKLFRAFKLKLYDRKIMKEIDLYFLSKRFFAFKSITEKQSKKSEQKAYRFYFKNLKRKMFQHLVDGVRNRIHERQLVELASQQYYFSLLRRVFESWKEISPREQRYIRLAMTTKNQLKETADKRLFQTQTFDFNQVK